MPVAEIEEVTLPFADKIEKIVDVAKELNMSPSGVLFSSRSTSVYGQGAKKIQENLTEIPLEQHPQVLRAADSRFWDR